jgi:hypothetical protein
VAAMPCGASASSVEGRPQLELLGVVLSLPSTWETRAIIQSGPLLVFRAMAGLESQGCGPGVQGDINAGPLPGGLGFLLC